MGTADKATTQEPINGGEIRWLDWYQVQSQDEYSRGITIPQTVDINKGADISIWCYYSDEQRPQHLKLATSSHSQREIPPNERFLGCRSVVPNGSGKLVTIPSTCDSQRFGVGARVKLACRYRDDNLLYLKAFPEQSLLKPIQPSD